MACVMEADDIDHLLVRHPLAIRNRSLGKKN
jgi:hypothetical protein